MKSFVIIKTSFPAVHSWPGCPFDDVAFLRTPHRHVFHVTVKFLVYHNDRDIEFIRKKIEIDAFLLSYKNKDLGMTSCEMLCEQIQGTFGADYVSVFEDDENGAELIV